MGLDMYLSKRSYVKNWGHTPKEEQHEVVVLKGGQPRSDIDPERISYIVEEVMYWRKANQIHAWFVDNVQRGVDECQETHVPRAKLEELATICRRVLLNPSLADELLPTRGGFFFGSTDYNDAYEQDLQDTLEMLERELADEPGRARYYYQSSW
jgi:hypothetical protein